MKSFFGAALGACLVFGSAVAEPNVTVTPAGSQPAVSGNTANFTGAVQILSTFKGTDPARISGGIVHFEPGARTAWHTHPVGQTLIVSEGEGRVQQWGGPVKRIVVGDIVWIPPGIKHWHGAAPDVAMTHTAITEVLDGKTVEWMEKVSDEQYRR